MFLIVQTYKKNVIVFPILKNKPKNICEFLVRRKCSWTRYFFSKQNETLTGKRITALAVS